MPIQQDLSTTVLTPIAGPDGEFVIRSGREIFEELSYTGLNRIPIQKLESSTLAHVTVKGDPPFEVKDTTNRILVDGSLALDRGTPLDHLLLVAPDRVVQYISGNRQKNEQGNYVIDSQNPLIVWDAQLKGDTWTKEKVKFWGAVKGIGQPHKPEVLERQTFDVGLLLPFPNGKGILYPVQRLYRRLESIAATLEKNTSKDRLKAFLLGYTGAQDKVQKLIDAGKEIISLPGVTGVHSVVSTELSQRLMEEFKLFRPEYLEATFIVQLVESNASGVAKAIDMMPFSNKVKETQALVKMLVQLYDVPEDTVTFDNPPTRPVEARLKELELLDSLTVQGIITPEEKADKARRLV